MRVAKRWRDVTLFLGYVENNNDNDESKLFGKRIFMNDLVFFQFVMLYNEKEDIYKVFISKFYKHFPQLLQILNDY